MVGTWALEWAVLAGIRPPRGNQLFPDLVQFSVEIQRERRVRCPTRRPGGNEKKYINFAVSGNKVGP